MAKFIPQLSGNTHKAPQQERLTAHEAPLVRHYEQQVDASLMNMYRQVLRIPLNEVVEQPAKPVVRASEQTPQSAPQAATQPYDNKLAEVSHFDSATPSAAAYNDHANRVAVQQALASVRAALEDNGNA